MAIKMTDMGVKEKFCCGPDNKKKIVFPRLHIEKKIGDFDIGDEVTMVVRAKVQSVRMDEDGFSQGFKVKSIGVKKSKSLGKKAR